MASFVLFTDSMGWNLVEDVLPREYLTAIVASTSRPQYVSDLTQVAARIGAEFLLHPAEHKPSYKSFVTCLRSLQPDLILSCSYSKKIPSEILGIARNGAFNIHYALLPNWRGRHPVQWAIIKGQRHTGVTLHEMSAEIDAGHIVDQIKVPIRHDDTWLSLQSQLCSGAKALLTRNLDSLVSGSWTSTAQDESLATTGLKRSPEDGFVDLKMSVFEIHNLIRALVPPMPPAFWRDSTGNKKYFDRYWSIEELFELKNRQSCLGFTWDSGDIEPTKIPENAIDRFLNFGILDLKNRTIGECVVEDYRHDEGKALFRRTVFDAPERSVNWSEFDELFMNWIREQLCLDKLEVA